MSAEPVPVSPARDAALDSSQPLWDRLSRWASEHKAVVYTIAGVAVVITGASVVYYSSSSRKRGDSETDEKKRASKKERRKAKREKDQAASQTKAPEQG